MEAEEADLARRHAPVVADTAFAAAVRRAGEASTVTKLPLPSWTAAQAEDWLAAGP